jgi:hypothetical protein
MEGKVVSMSNTLPQPTRQRLSNLRNKLLYLHQILLKMERNAYEQVHGQVSPGELLQLLIQHDQFAWLRNISQLVVRIDETLEAKDPVSLDEVESMLVNARTLFAPSENGNGFQRKYYDALQLEPDAVLAHAEVTEILAQK